MSELPEHRSTTPLVHSRPPSVPPSPFMPTNFYQQQQQQTDNNQYQNYTLNFQQNQQPNPQQPVNYTPVYFPQSQSQPLNLSTNPNINYNYNPQPMTSMSSSTFGIGGVGGAPGLGYNPGLAGFNYNMTVGAGGNYNIPTDTLRYLEHQRMSQYYHQYYQRYIQSLMVHQHQQQLRNARRTPKKFTIDHYPASFGPCNQLVTIQGSRVIIQKLDTTNFELIPESITNCASCWPGPLNDDTNSDDVIEWLRSRDDQPIAWEMRIIIRVIQKLIKQNGKFSGSDLVDVLVSNNMLNETFGGVYNVNNDNLGDDNSVCDASISEKPLDQYRRYLILGHKKTALGHASKNKLFDHYFALNFLLNPPREPASAVNNFLEGIKTFINSCISRDDPLYALYSQLIQQCSNTNKATLHNKQQIQPRLVDSLEQFAILLANDCKVDVTNTSYPLLINLMVQLVEKNSQHVIRTDVNDYLFINECLEFARKLGTIESLIPHKLIYAAKLFDYGLIEQSLKYCQVIKDEQNRTTKHTKNNWPLILKIINDIETRSGLTNDNTFDYSDLYEKSLINNPNSSTDDNDCSNSNKENNRFSGDQIMKSDSENLNQQFDSLTITNTNKVNDINVNNANQNDNQTDSVPNLPLLNQQQQQQSNLFTNVIPQTTYIDRTHDGIATNKTSQSKTNWRRHRNSSVSSTTSRSSVLDQQLQQQQSLPQQQFNYFVPQINNNNNNIEEPLNFVSTGNFIQLPTEKAINNYQPSNDDEYYGKSNANTDNSLTPRNDETSKNESTKSQPQIQSQQQQQTPQSKSLLGGIFGRFVPKTKQAILPDDKSPTIVWDEETKQWIDKSADPAEQQQRQQIANGPPKIKVPLVTPAAVSPTVAAPPFPLPGNPPMGANSPAAAPPLPNASQFQFKPTSTKKSRYIDVLNSKA